MKPEDVNPSDVWAVVKAIAEGECEDPQKCCEILMKGEPKSETDLDEDQIDLEDYA